MGERGPVPIPYARRRNKRTNKGKTVLVGRPDVPENLEGEARDEWERIVPEIESMGLLAVVDRAILIRYCRAWANWWELDDKLAKTGLLVQGRHNNELRRNPLWLMRSDIETTLSDLGKQLGLTPAARLRQGVEHEQPQEEETAAPVVMDKYRKAIGL